MTTTAPRTLTDDVDTAVDLARDVVRQVLTTAGAVVPDPIVNAVAGHPPVRDALLAYGRHTADATDRARASVDAALEAHP